ncbi:hypothetical protein, partial [Mycetocola reblochoni]
MALMVSPQAATLFQVLTGERFPQANEDQLRALARGWTTAATEMRDIESELTRELRGAGRSFSGRAKRSFVGRASALTDGGTLGQVADGFGSSAAFLKKLALDVEYTKYTLIGALIALIAEIAWAVAMAVPSFGSSMIWLAARKAMYTVFFRTLLRKLVAEAAKGAVFNVVTELAIDA